MSSSEASREDRQLEASQQRIDQAREEGQLPRSRELVHLAVAGALALLLSAASVAVGGWNFTLKALEPKFERLDPLAGVGRMFSRQGLLDHLRVIVVATTLLAAGGWYLWRHGEDIQSLARMPLAAALSHGFEWITEGIALLAGVALLATLADIPLQVFKQKAELRMTRDEARQENKEAEGDPHVKGERRRRARELSRGRMLADVPAASVVITNPTHYAVALRYDENAGGAPTIVAAGADHLALKIREVAKAARVPVLEAPPLARALYKHGDIGKEVPVALYTAVAQVLAWVYGLRDARRAVAEPVIDVPPGLDPNEVQA